MPLNCDLLHMTWDCLGRFSAFALFMNSVRYYPLAGLLLGIFWFWKRDYFQPWRIQEHFPKMERIWYEVRYSFATLLIFAALGVLGFALYQLGYIPFYTDVKEGGYFYLIATFLLLTVWHETWFYWMHRIVHFKPLYKAVHLVHHKSVNPSPMAAYSFHPWEAILEGMYLLLFVLVIPTHPLVVVVHTILAMLLNIVGHLGYEIYPSGWTRHWLTRWINTPTHHNLHHSRVNCNYSLYCNFWDWFCKTNHPEYHKTFEGVCARRKQASILRRAKELQRVS